MEETREKIPEASLVVSEPMLARYLDVLREQGRSQETLRMYRSKLSQMVQILPEDRRIRRGTLEEMRMKLLAKGYSASTVNSFTAAVNGFLDYYGHREFQVSQSLKGEPEVRPELTRSEYLRLLGAARRLNRERAYLLVKLFAGTGVMIAQLSQVTVEAVREGRLLLGSASVHIPAPLRGELLNYAERQGIGSGMIFRTRGGGELDRSNLSREIRGLAGEARVAPEKCSPRCLQHLHQTTTESIWENISVLVDQASDRLAEREQRAVGWSE
ncbi:MAG: site-specific integrase [Lachnospiraceae bacterium]|nr:site-specific integrase [Lachnospiraceae bacterium]